MNKAAIQKFAVWARNELIAQVKQRAFQYGIVENNNADYDANADVVNEQVLTPREKRQRQSFIGEIKRVGFAQAVEEVAYTWFNRFIALRFMEVNDYLPTHVRVFSDSSGVFAPEILKDALHLDLDGLDKAKVTEMLESNATDDLYRYLLLTQCNALNAALPEMFAKLADYTELLLPGNILKPSGVPARLVGDIPEDDWKNAVQIIGWLYQYYNTEPKQAVFDGLKKNVKISKEKIPAATQLFTPEWIVKYMVENSLGRLWLESHPESTLNADWRYYLDEAEQSPEVAAKLAELRAERKGSSPESITFIDPCMGSGHILVYAFDVLMQMYRSAGYADRDAAVLILEKNLYGLDIDKRAYQLAYFALMMKARQYNRRILSNSAAGIAPQVYHPGGWNDGEDFGSLLKIDTLEDKPLPATGQLDLDSVDDVTALRVWNFKRLLSQKYDVVCTNPPYMGGSGQNGGLVEFLKTNYTDFKSDTFSAFVEKCRQLCKRNGYIGMFTPYVWMFIQSYEKLRNMIYNNMTISSLIQFEYSAFEEAVVPICTFALRNSRIADYSGTYLRLVDFRGGMEVQRLKTLEAIENPDCGYRYTASADNFAKIPGSPVAYWVGKRIFEIFNNSKSLEFFGNSKVGLQTGDTNRFLRLWHEVEKNIYLSSLKRRNEFKWFPICKGGDFRKWYGNNEYVVNWENDGIELRNFKDDKGKLRSRPQNIDFYFKRGITWNLITSTDFAVRCYDEFFIFDVSANSFFCDDDKYEYFAGLLNSKVMLSISKCLNPTINFSAGVVANLPIVLNTVAKNTIDELVVENIDISREDWDSFETSWDFKKHPLV